MVLTHLNGLRALEAAVRHGSFKAAAVELGVTPAAIGQQVRNLESALGQQLLVRHANRFEPSENTKQAVAMLASGFAEIHRAFSLLAQTRAPNRVFVTVTPSIAERWLAPRLSHFLARFPEVDMRIDSTPYVHYVSGSEFDFAIRYDRSGRSGYDETELFREILIPVCTPDIARMMGPVDRPDCLSEVPLLHVDRSTDDPDWFHWDEWGERFGYEIPKMRQRLHITYTTLALRSLYDGHGLHLAQLSITLPDLLSGRLTAPFGVSKCVRPGYPYSLVTLHPGSATPLLREFRRWIVEEADSTRADMDRYMSAPQPAAPEA